MAATAFDWLFGLAQFGIKFGLDNIRAIVDELGHPERAFRSIHVAGTNGKGSVTAIVDTALRNAGYRTGRYTSPHLLRLAERFAVDGVPVSDADLARAVDEVRGAVDRLRACGTLDVHPTFFEVTTATAFVLFREKNVAVATCEVGLGGRLDATNVLTPMACAITSIGFDHQQYLGHTLREIAAEKAGIIKPATPVIVGPVAADAADAIAARAKDCDAPVVWATTGVDVSPASEGPGGQSFTLRTPLHDYGQVRLALAGEHQVSNAIVAVRVLETVGAAGLSIEPHHVVDALAHVRWPGRMERIDLPGGREALLDAAHNRDGAAALARELARAGDRRPLVFAAMRDKEIEAMLATLAPQVSRIVVTRASNPRSMEPADLAAIARSVAPAVPVDVAGTPAGALAAAWEHSPRIVVAGSIFLLADVMKELGRT